MRTPQVQGFLLTTALCALISQTCARAIHNGDIVQRNVSFSGVESVPLVLRRGKPAKPAKPAAAPAAKPAAASPVAQVQLSAYDYGKKLLSEWKAQPASSDHPLTLYDGHLYKVIDSFEKKSAQTPPQYSKVLALDAPYQDLNPKFFMGTAGNVAVPTLWDSLEVRSGPALILEGMFDRNKETRPGKEQLFHRTDIMVQGRESANAFIVLLMSKGNDANPKETRLQQCDLMAQYFIKNGFNKEIDRVIQYDVQNTETLGYIVGAITELGRGQTHKYIIKAGGTAAEQKWFTTLIGSPNGRGTQRMLNKYAFQFNNRKIASIGLWDQRGLPRLKEYDADKVVMSLNFTPN